LLFIIDKTADKSNIEKFGEDYRRYMQKVPRLNPLLGIYKFFQRK